MTIIDRAVRFAERVKCGDSGVRFEIYLKKTCTFGFSP